MSGPKKTPEQDLISCHLGDLLTNRNMTLTELGKRVGISIVNLSLLKNGHAKAIRFSTLHAICQVLECEVGDLLTITTNTTGTTTDTDTDAAL